MQQAWSLLAEIPDAGVPRVRRLTGAGAVAGPPSQGYRCDRHQGVIATTYILRFYKDFITVLLGFD